VDSGYCVTHRCKSRVSDLDLGGSGIFSSSASRSRSYIFVLICSFSSKILTVIKVKMLNFFMFKDLS